MFNLRNKTLFFSAQLAPRMTANGSHNTAVGFKTPSLPASNPTRAASAFAIWPPSNFQKDLANRFLFAASKNDIFAIQLLLNLNTINCTNQRGQTALILATIAGNYSIVQFLISKGANVLVCDKYGFTPLMYAIKFLHKNIITLFLSANASIFHTNRSGISAFSLTILPQINNLRSQKPKAKKIVKDIIFNEITQLILMEYYRLTAQVFIDNQVDNLQNFVKFIMNFTGNPTNLQIRRLLILDFIYPLLKEITLPIQIQIKPYCLMREALSFDFPPELVAIIVGYVNSAINPEYHIDERKRNHKLLKITDQIFVAKKLEKRTPEANAQERLYSHQTILPETLIFNSNIFSNTDSTINSSLPIRTPNSLNIKLKR